jgi:superfamily II DNA or RNA helicase
MWSKCVTIILRKIRFNLLGSDIVDSAKSSIIGHLYDHMDENDWLDGLDIYQAGHVSALRGVESLITAKVASSAERQPSEVRIKIHPTGTNIQWIECTCRKNRVTGRYCEHIGATMLFIDREKPKVFANLDPKIPLKAPPAAPRRKLNEPLQKKITDKKTSSTQAVLAHMMGQIHSVALLANGPQLRVRLEIKENQLTTYNLDIDDSAEFLRDHGIHESSASPEVQKLRVFDLSAKLGFRLTQDPTSDSVIITKALAFELPEGLLLENKSILDKATNDLSTCFELWQGVRTEKRLKFFEAKQLNKYLGKRWAFLEGVGYFPYSATAVSSQWSDLPHKKIYKDDDAARLFLSGFSDYAGAGPVWLTPEIDNDPVIENVKFSSLDILDQDSETFSIQSSFESAGFRISMIDIIEEYRSKKREFIRSKGKWIQVPELVKQFPWQVDEKSHSLKVDRLQLMRLKAELGEFDQLAGSKKMLDKIRDEIEFRSESVPPALTSSNLNLRSYQTDGYSWMWWLYNNGLSGLLADEMGLGKTHQAMAVMTAIANTKKDAKFLVICPTTVLDHWLDKMASFSPGLNPKRYHGLKRTHILDEVGSKSTTLLSSYGIVMRDIDQLSQIYWDVVILDEAHFVKNIDTATYKAVCRLRSKSRFCLSGTPMENHLGELKAVYDFLLPGYLGSNDYFRERYLAPQTGNDSTMSLQKLIHPFKMRRTKNLVLKDLPEKVEDIRHCQLSDEQQIMYRQTLELKAQPLLEVVKDEGKAIPFLHVFSVITLLKQICDHPALLTDVEQWQEHQSGKFDLFRELIDEAIESGHKVVVYSQYLDMIEIIGRYLSSQKIGFATLTGSTRNRGDVIAKFQNDPDIKVFCASLLAGGVGIDLTSASVVIHYDRWWNASKENQATDRVHRIGQNKNVQVLKLVTRNTLEERIDALINKKRELFEKFLDHDEEMFKTLSRAEIIDLLQ